MRQSRKRDIRKIHNEYIERFISSKKGEFFVDDIDQIVNINTRKKDDAETMMFDTILYALESGFMIGYDIGKKDGIQNTKGDDKQ